MNDRDSKMSKKDLPGNLPKDLPRDLIDKFHSSNWKLKLMGAFDKVRKVTQSGIHKSEKLSKLAKQNFSRGLLLRERKKLYSELGELAFELMDREELSHADLARSFERIKGVNHSLRELKVSIDRIGNEMKGHQPDDLAEREPLDP